LAVPAAPLAPPAGTLFWVDASRPGTIDTDMAGGVTEWRDVTGNGRYARPIAGRSAPTLRGNDFAGLPTVDMGPYGIAGSAGMLWNQRLTGMRTVACARQPGERRLPAGRDERHDLPPRAASGRWTDRGYKFHLP
jgi:hypothetical protein